MKKKTILLSAILVVYAMLSPVALADSALVNQPDVGEIVYLSEEEVLSIADLQIAGYLQTEVDQKSAAITPSTDFIDLHDLDGTVFAYVVPLVEDGVGEIGYIVVGAMDDGYSTYIINMNKESLSALRKQLDGTLIVADMAAEDQPGDLRPVTEEEIDRNRSVTYINTHDKDTVTNLVFLPPMTFILEVERAGEKSYYDISNAGSPANDVTSIVKENEEEINKSYSLIRSSEHKAAIDELLLYSASDIATNNSRSNVDVRVSDELESTTKFVRINRYNKYFYGGAQAWYSSTDRQKRGCAPVAAANITYYIAEHDPYFSRLYPGYINYYTDDEIKHWEFTLHMDQMYAAIDPSILGVFSITNWANRVITYADSKLVNGHYLTYTAMNAPAPISQFTKTQQKNRCISTITNGLYSNCPVASLNLLWPFVSDYEYSWHWVTITKYFSNNAGSWVAVSTWGRRESIDFNVYFDYAYAYGGGFVYFTNH